MVTKDIRFLKKFKKVYKVSGILLALRNNKIRKKDCCTLTNIAK